MTVEHVYVIKPFGGFRGLVCTTRYATRYMLGSTSPLITFVSILALDTISSASHYKGYQATYLFVEAWMAKQQRAAMDIRGACFINSLRYMLPTVAETL